ncbi:unnamed protein product (macronuclear) [Paramecium tetraurelia]|uniref:Uncharacterized protein n=1 Tax=Paramecium tetraurelia TaxID=5888 RepID=A0BNF8_PARTE|nr:uncharacterized protein GSPATT00030713001 [Paramecium tetraurelia]CAK60075.1 unnamed protein product [Paramecium tetraurelia]|eukprot:XP_001427473.1 hypothetical protein (macronuclear) [Paramecium tetraurelia strain d4-2]
MAHKLSQNWVFWYAPRGRKAIAGSDHYDVNLKEIGEFNTVEEFYSYYCYLQRPSEVDIDNKIMMFRKEHKPMWEECLDGGTWIIHFKKRESELLNKKWEALLLGCWIWFDDDNVIGVVLSIRERRNLLEIWLKDRKESEKIRIGEKLRVALEMDPNNLTFFFKEHSKSLNDKSTMKGAESYTFVKTPLETPQTEPKGQHPDLDQFKL